MFVHEIKEYDKFSYEADIIISDGKYSLLCYCYPTEMPKIGETIKKITSLFAKNIVKVYNNNFKIEKLIDYYSYHLQGEVIDIVNPKIRIGNLEIDLDVPFPKDIKKSEYVELSVDRLDCTFTR